jgi:hypothetical protein
VDEQQGEAMNDQDLIRRIEAAMSKSPVPRPPPDCDLAEWVEYALRGWRSEREEASHLSDLCERTHKVLDGYGAPRDGAPAQRAALLIERLTVLAGLSAPVEE